MIIRIPQSIIDIIQKLEIAGFEAYVVGGCVRDLLMGIEPKDWDVTTNAKPEEVMKIFGEDNSFYENKFGTVGVKSDIGVVEVTTYRIESKYSDKRRPDKVEFAKTLEEDLSRRYFTINSVALEIPNPKSQIPYKSQLPKSKIINGVRIIDPYEGIKDLGNKIIRAVGDPNERFDEDALRMMRAVRFAVTLGGDIKVKKTKGPRKLSEKTPFVIEKKMKEAIAKN
ncbi:MAG: hypothetical protein QXO70_00515, partial [Candidatus Pacearchaeota archaeon]